MMQHQVNGTKRFVVDPDLSGSDKAYEHYLGVNICAPWEDLF